MWSRRLVGWQDGRRRRDGAEQDALRVRGRAFRSEGTGRQIVGPTLPARLITILRKNETSIMSPADKTATT
ncbi:MAG: hypothetical protein ABMA01_19175, partial [Chthoniobacteraceae bacterium]